VEDSDVETFNNYVGYAIQFFRNIIAVDVVYNDLTVQQLERVERSFERYSKFYKENATAWTLAPYGVNTAYAIYKGDEEEITFWKNKYEAQLFDLSMTKDGSWGQSPGYAFFRTQDRIAKCGIIDVLNFTGRADYYNDPRMQKLNEWIFTFGLTPTGGHTMFGDSGHFDNYLGRMPKVYFASNYGTKIKGLTDYHHVSPATFLGSSFFVYALRQPNYKKEPKMPASLLREHSGAALWGKTGTKKELLQGVLYNLKPNLPNIDQFGHAKQETNSLGIFAYGQYLLMNSGYMGYGAATPDGTDLRSAHVNGTVLIGDKKRHSANYGNGLIDGVVGGNIEFATTDAGAAIQNGSHKRTLHMVHSIPNKSNGYFIVHDEVKPNDLTDKVSINFQANTKHKDTKQITKNQEYQSPINGHVFNNVPELNHKVTLFFASKPDEVSIDKSVKAAMSGRPYLESDNVKPQYQAGADGYVRATTVIFPEDPNHQKPDISKISSPAYSGAKITHTNDFVDCYLGANPSTKNTFDSTIKFTASTTFFRKESGETMAYASTNGTEFIDSREVAYGYRSTLPVSVEMEKNAGFINAKENAYVKFYLKNGN